MAGTDAYEETVKKFNLDPEKEYKDKPGEIPLPVEWRAEIIKYHIEKKLENVEYINQNNPDRTFTIVFKSKDDVKKNEEKFHASIIQSLNEYIRVVKEDNPKKYYRGLILETTADGISFTVKY